MENSLTENVGRMNTSSVLIAMFPCPLCCSQIRVHSTLTTPNCWISSRDLAMRYMGEEHIKIKSFTFQPTFIFNWKNRTINKCWHQILHWTRSVTHLLGIKKSFWFRDCSFHAMQYIPHYKIGLICFSALGRNSKRNVFWVILQVMWFPNVHCA